MSEPARHIYNFGPFELDILARRLTRAGEPLALTPKALDLLVILVEHRGRLLAKDELMRWLWPDTFVEEANLTQYIFTLRKQLGEQPGGRAYIETVSRRGYRFVAEVNEVREPASAEQPEVERTIPGRVRDVGARGAVAMLLVVVAVAGVAWFNGRRSTTPGDPPAGKTLAILPFRALEPGGADEYLALGMADAIITRLARIHGLVVRPTSSVLKYVTSPVDPLAVARELSVDSLVDGRFQRLDDRVRVTVQLLAARDGSPIWAGTFDEPFKDVFTVQDRISERVAEALVATLTDEERARLTRRFTGNTEAYQLYLRGRYFWERRTDDSLRKSVDYYRQAIAHDPTYALAYAGLADSYLIMGNFSMLAPGDAFPKARAAAQKALDIDASVTQARVALAFVTYLYDRNWDEAERGFVRALSEAPNYGPGHQWYAVSLTSRGRFDEAVAEIERAERVDPLSLVINAVRAWILYLSRRYDEAIEQAKRTIDMDAGFPLPHYYLGLAYLARGRHADAAEELRKSSAMYGSQGRDKDLAALGLALARQGRTADARAVLNELQQPVRERYVSPYAAAVVYLGLGDSGQALVLLERAADERFPWAMQYNVDPLLDTLRADPRFKALLQRIGIPEVPLPPPS
jgi:DNA-binding winged helix-turn-helix (wHTH) protein/TolB-like protein/TolA-binding protein